MRNVRRRENKEADKRDAAKRSEKALIRTLREACEEAAKRLQTATTSEEATRIVDAIYPPASSDDAGPAPDGPDVDGDGDSDADDLAALTVSALRELAKQRDVYIPSGAKKADIVAVLS